jgi:isoleucyl-tRNA synthetase
MVCIPTLSSSFNLNLITCLVSQQFNFSREEEKVIEYWREIDAFQTSLKLSEGKPEYVFFDGPPFATGLPHYGHLLAGTIKVRSDLILSKTC